MLKQIHLINGDDLANNVKKLGITDDLIVWREMFCEGPTGFKLDSEESIKIRIDYLNSQYKIAAADYQDQFLKELEKLSVINGDYELVLWFEFDLFSHLNICAAISHLLENKKDLRTSLVCSKKLKGEKEQEPLSQLRVRHLRNHYEQRIELNENDLITSNVIWQFYNGQEHQKLKRIVKKETNFEYLSSCIRAHIERFPNSTTGLNALEKNILKLILTHKITSKNQLLGYALQYQGYYGYTARQMERILNSLERFYKIDDQVALTEEGEEALNGTRNFYRELRTDEYFGGAKIYDFLYDPESHKLLKL